MEGRQMFNSDLTSGLHQKLNPLKIGEGQAMQLRQGNERIDMPKQRPKNEKNIFADQMVSKRIEDDKTFKPKVVPRAEKFATAIEKKSADILPKSSHKDNKILSSYNIPKTEYKKTVTPAQERISASVRVQAKPISVAASTSLAKKPEEEKSSPVEDNGFDKNARKFFGVSSHCSRKPDDKRVTSKASAVSSKSSVRSGDSNAKKMNPTFVSNVPLGTENTSKSKLVYDPTFHRSALTHINP